MPFEKLNSFSFNHKDQQDELYKTMDPEQVKAAFDSRAEEVRASLNKLITDLETSGASSIGATEGNLQTLITTLKNVLDETVSRTTELEETFSQFTLSDGNSNPEIVLARTDSVSGTVYSLIGDRMRVMDSRTVNNSDLIETINANINTINTNINTANGRINTNITNIAAANTRIDTANANIVAANTRIDTVNNDLSATKKKINQGNIGKRQYIKYFASGDRVQIAFKYADSNSLIDRVGDDAIIEFGISSGVNRLFQILRLWKKDNSEGIYPDSNLASYEPWYEINTDIIGPITFKALANGYDNMFMATGGVYGFLGEGIGTPTARQVTYEIYADGKKLNPGDEIFADVITIRSIQQIQGYNTKTVGGTGREILRQTVNYQMIDGCIEISCNLTALEALEIEAYHGLQYPWGSPTPFINGTIHYVRGEGYNRKPLTSSIEHSSGSKSAFGIATRFTLKSPTGNHVLNAWIDENFGFGDGANVVAAAARSFSRFNKAHLAMVNGANRTMAANTTVSWRGGISMFKNEARTVDVVGKMSKNNKVWTVIDFITNGTEGVAVMPETMFYTDYEEAFRTNGIALPVNNYATRAVVSGGYGQIIYRFKK